MWANTTAPPPQCNPKGADKTIPMPSIPPFQWRPMTLTFNAPATQGDATWRFFVESLCLAPGAKADVSTRARASLRGAGRITEREMPWSGALPRACAYLE